MYYSLGQMFGVAVLCGGIGWAVVTDNWWIGTMEDGIPLVIPLILGALVTWVLWPITIPVLLSVVLARKIRARRVQQKLRDEEIERILTEPL